MDRIPDRPSSPGSPLVHSNRRDFVKSLLLLGGVPWLAKRGLGAAAGRGKFEYQYRTMSVSHFSAMQAFIDKLRDEGRLSRNPTFRSYIDPKKRNFALPEGFKTAKSLIVIAIVNPPLAVAFHPGGRVRQVVLSPGYYNDGITADLLLRVVREDIVRDPAARIELTRAPHLKLAAVRSGLGFYGRNNICYVEGMGSYLALNACLTDHEFPEDHWQPLAMHPECERCDICYGACPTGAISRDRFVIDAGRCLTLYNEIPGEFPNFILPSMHNALMGCLKCQENCPLNEKSAPAPIRLEDVTEEETEKSLKGIPDDALIRSLSRKLKGFVSDKESFPVFTRNLRALLR
jgi:epoxyqueuosine reductase